MRRFIASGDCGRMEELQKKLSEDHGYELNVVETEDLDDDELDQVPGGSFSEMVLVWDHYDEEHPNVSEPRLQYLKGFADCFMAVRGGFD